jgi:hypothetical protein
MDDADWMLLGGGLLIVAGGAAFAMRRRPSSVASRDEVYENDRVAPVVPASVSPEFVPIQFTPAMASSLNADPELPLETVAEAPVATPAPRPMAVIPTDDRHAALEAMVAEQPTEANPFCTRRQRLRRADYLLRTGQARPVVAGQAQPSVEQEQVSALAGDRWSQQSFGGRRMRPINWKPATR